MGDLIDANEAKALLGCDDATLQNLINNGTIRAQRNDAGELVIQREDVANLGSTSATSDSDEGTIILSGDSEDLSIDLGEVVDDASAAQSSGDDSRDQTSAESISFDDELEVINFDDDGQTQELNFDDDDPGATVVEDLSFTDSNSAVQSDAHTDVDETMVATGTGTATATATGTDDFQTIDYGDEPDETNVGSSVRRSARAQRVREAPPKKHPVMVAIMALTLLILGFSYVPFAVMMVPPRGEHGDGAENHGVKDNLWAHWAATLAAFSLEPDPEVFAANNPSKTWHPINEGILDETAQDFWAHQEYRGGKTSEERAEEYVIDNLQNAQDEETGESVPTSAQSTDENGSPVKTFDVEQTTQGNPDTGSAPIYEPAFSW